MNDVERLAIEQAIYNAIGADLKNGVDGNLRGQVDEHYRALYEQTGATGFEVRVNGRKVGTYGFNRVKGKPERRSAEFVVSDMARLREWRDGEFGGDFDHWVDRYVDEHLEGLALIYAEETGEVPDGVELVEYVEPATPDTIRPNGTLRVSAQKVADALGPALPSAIAGLLGGGE